MRATLWGLVCAFLALAITGCGGSAETASAPSQETRVERCVDRFLARIDEGTEARIDAEELRRYVETTYCDRFESRGWVYDDGSLRIEAHRWATETGAECAEAEAGGPARTIPCEAPEKVGGTFVLDCAVLHYVRRTAVEAYVAELQSEGEVECDDGTDVSELGAEG